MIEQLTGKAKSLLLAQLPAIQKHISEQMPAFLKTYGMKGVQFVTDSERLTPLFGTVYQSLPLPVRVLVKQDTFVRFCLSQKENLVGKWLEAGAPETAVAPAPAAKGKAKPVVPKTKPAGVAKSSTREEAVAATPPKGTRTKKKPVPQPTLVPTNS
jgi:hypothetical protein